MFLFTSPLSLAFLCPSSFPHRENFSKTWAITVIPHPLPTFPISSHSYSERVRRKFRRNFTPDDTLFLLQPSRFRSRSSFSLSMSKFRTSTANGYYLSHSKFIVQRVIIMPSFVQYQTTDIMTESFLMVEVERKGFARNSDVSETKTQDAREKGRYKIYSSFRRNKIRQERWRKHNELASRFSSVSHPFPFSFSRNAWEFRPVWCEKSPLKVNCQCLDS